MEGGTQQRSLAENDPRTRDRNSTKLGRKEKYFSEECSHLLTIKTVQYSLLICIYKFKRGRFPTSK